MSEKDPDKTVEKEMTFLEHLEELRWHLIRSVIAVFVCGMGIFMLKEFVFETIIFAPKKPSFPTYQFFCALSEATCFQPPKFDLITRELGEQFFTHIKVSIWLGIVVSFPYILFEIWRFIKPGLYKEERKAARGFVFICSLLFFMGILFGYYVLSPFSISFLAGYQVGETAINAPTLASYVGYMTMFTLPCGFLFELPIIVHFLAKVGLITPAFMKKYRRHAFVIILLLAALITPPDVLTQFLIGIPIFILYEVSILIAKRTIKKANAK